MRKGQFRRGQPPLQRPAAEHGLRDRELHRHAPTDVLGDGRTMAELVDVLRRMGELGLDLDELAPEGPERDPPRLSGVVRARFPRAIRRARPPARAFGWSRPGAAGGLGLGDGTTAIVVELRHALVDAGAKPELADKAAEAMIDHSEREQLATRGDLAAVLVDLKAELHRAILVQTGVTIGAIVALLKLLP